MTTQTAHEGPSETPSDLSALARQHGLRRVGARPHIGAYTRTLWSRRHFVWSMASAKAYSRNQNNHLGQLWAVLTPILLAGVYYLVFGVLLDTRGGTDNYVGFLVIGIFAFIYISGTINSGASAISGHLGMVRALSFPRAVLPLAVALSQFLTFVPALAVMLVIVLLTGERPDTTWLLFPVAILLLLLFNIGCSFLAARIVVAVRDLRNLIPLIIRLLRYFSGVFFSVAHYTAVLHEHGTLGSAAGYTMQYQPVAVYLEVIRSTVLDETAPDPLTWGFAVAWAVLFLGVGYVVFWQAEDRYGRD